MPTIKEKLQDDWKKAMKARDKFKSSTLSMARAAVLQAEKSDGKKLDDEKVIEVLAREVKMRRESIPEFQKGNRQDLVDKTNDEINILLQYLPAQLSKDEVKEYIKQAAAEVGANNIKDMGKIMKNLKTKLSGRADMKAVSQLVKEYLS